MGCVSTVHYNTRITVEYQEKGKENSINYERISFNDEYVELKDSHDKKNYIPSRYLTEVICNTYNNIYILKYYVDEIDIIYNVIIDNNISQDEHLIKKIYQIRNSINTLKSA